MAFANEKISESDQIRINYGSLRDPQNQQKLVGTPKWTVDIGREAFLIHIGGGISRDDHHIPYYFLFSLRDTRIMVQAFQKRKPADDPTLGVVTWQIIRLELPEDSLVCREEILQILTEAFIAYGKTGTQWSHLNLKSVEVDLSKIVGE